tara:strand:- start:175 stop:333 length:159 start_codon:yes stop_codon:yes gene_type:complete
VSKDASIRDIDVSSNADDGSGSDTDRSTENMNDLLKNIGELEATAPDYGVGK